MRRSLLTAAGIFLVALAGLAQRREQFEFGYGMREPAIRNVPYDGQFTFVRVKYETAPGGFWRRSPSGCTATPSPSRTLDPERISLIGAPPRVNVWTSTIQSWAASIASL